MTESTDTQELDLSWLDETARRIAELDREFGCNVLDVGGAALTWHVYGDHNQFGFSYVWQYIAGDEESAHAYYASLSREERLTEGASALADAGWTRRSICMRLS